MNFGDWFASSGSFSLRPQAAERAAAAWRRINDKPTSIVVLRSVGATKSKLAAQTVRVELSTTASDMRGEVVTPSKQTAIVFGVLDHPDSGVPDTDIRGGDRFTIGSTTFEVIGVVSTIGEIQATCEAIT